MIYISSQTLQKLLTILYPCIYIYTYIHIIYLYIVIGISSRCSMFFEVTAGSFRQTIFFFCVCVCSFGIFQPTKRNDDVIFGVWLSSLGMTRIIFPITQCLVFWTNDLEKSTDSMGRILLDILKKKQDLTIVKTIVSTTFIHYSPLKNSWYLYPLGTHRVMVIGPDGVPVPCPAALAASESAVGAWKRLSSWEICGFSMGYHLDPSGKLTVCYGKSSCLIGI